MKIRRGFVSNSSSTCFICGEWIEEGEHICAKCTIDELKRVDVNRFAKWVCNKHGLDYDVLFEEYMLQQGSRYTETYKRLLEVEGRDGKHL